MPAPFALPLQIHKRIHSKFLSVTSRSSHTDHPGDAPLGAVDQLSLWPFYDSLEIRVVNGVSPAFTPKNQIEMHRLLEQGRGFMAERRQVVPKLTKLRPARAITAVPKAQFQHGTTSAKTRSLSSSDQHSISEAAQHSRLSRSLHDDGHGGCLAAALRFNGNCKCLGLDFGPHGMVHQHVAAWIRSECSGRHGGAAISA
jgi:hypothetical protein